MPNRTFGLRFPKSATQTLKADSKRRVDLGENDVGEDEGKPPNPVALTNEAIRQNAVAKASHLSQVFDALKSDPTIFDYDSFHDHQASQVNARKRKAKRSTEGPRYVGSLMQSAKRRQLERLRAEQRMALKKADMDDEEEKFITGGYAAKLKELDDIEKAEEARDAQTRGQTQSFGPNFGESLMRKREAGHEAASSLVPVEAEANDEPREDQPAFSKHLSEADIEALRAQGIRINESGEVVDKTQLLKPGLNVPAGARIKNQRKREREREEIENPDRKRTADKDRRRLHRLTERRAQYFEEESRAQGEREREVRLNRLEQTLKAASRKNDASSVSSARERYLARKRAREANADHSSSDSEGGD